jgi:lysyl-tRNA synthetase class 2
MPRKEAPNPWQFFDQLDIGDFIGVEGETFVTKTGEPSIKATGFTVLSKSLRPLPDKWHGVQDTEIKYRQRYLDLVSNPESMEVFQKRIAIVREIRRFLEDRGFIEVETPMMQAIPGGAAAAPFKTHHKRARSRPLPPNRSRALFEAPSRGWFLQNFRTQPQLP